MMAFYKNNRLPHIVVTFGSLFFLKEKLKDI
jgi:hypothetical protein